jgi:hypothetical protein
MTNLIVATSMKEQQDIMRYIKEELNSMYLTDHTVTIIAGISWVDVIHTIKDTQNLAARYQVVVVPVSMSLENLNGFSHSVNININKLLIKLDQMKAEAISFVNAHKIPSIKARRDRDAFANAAQRLFS